MLFESHPYATLWNKYRPVILQLMRAAGTEPQQYKLFAHEFKAVGQRERSGYSFSIKVAGGKAVNRIKDSAVAADLLGVLQQSQKASELMREAEYELTLDKQFVLHVSRCAVVEAAAPVAE